ncbi:hypothetical protein HDU98_004665 [Podochytrium sp. JEL0797]|nr:hypothetical protein HDU98_004665 [Podochytrium sp. JEL0797]
MNPRGARKLPDKIAPHSTLYHCFCIPHVLRNGAWESLPKCEFEILTDADGGDPRVVVAMEGTKKVVAVVRVSVELGVEVARGDVNGKSFTFRMQSLLTNQSELFTLRVKSPLQRAEIVHQLHAIQQMTLSASVHTVLPHLFRNNIPPYIRLCKHLEKTHTLVVDCNVSVKTPETEDAVQNLGMGKVCLATLESPVGDFKIVRVVSENKAGDETVLLESVITRDILVQDCRTTTCALLKILFASKQGVEYHLELVVGQVEGTGVSLARSMLDSGGSQVVVNYLTKDVMEFGRVFECRGGEERKVKGMVRSASCLLEETAASKGMLGVQQKASKGARNLTAIASSGKRLTAAAAGGATKVGGWVASQVRFFNGLAQRPGVVPVPPVNGREKVAVAPPRKASAFCKQKTEDALIDAEAEKWAHYFSVHAPTVADSREFSFPPQSCPEDLLANWIFIPRSGKMIISSVDVFDQVWSILCGT